MFEEHLGYIADHIRSDRFRQAIARAIGPGDCVVDAGCGFGVLGLMCLEAGADRVWGIDQTAAIDVARETVHRAGFGSRYTCIRESVSRAVVPEPVDVVICDHVGYFGVDYGIVALLANARRFLKPGGTVLPRRIRLVLAGASSHKARSEAEAWAAETIPAPFHWLRQHGVNSKRKFIFSAEEIVTDAVVLGDVDLCTENPDRFVFDARLTASRDIVLDGLAGWFECELAQDVWITNSPLSPDRIDRPQLFLAFDQPIALQAGETVAAGLSIAHEDHLIGWTVRGPDGRRQKHSNWDSQVLALPELSRAADQVLKLSTTGRARRLFYRLCEDGKTLHEIETLMRGEAADLFPSARELAAFVRAEWARSRA